MEQQRYVGRGGEKLKAAIDAVGLNVSGAVAADFGCNIGGFTDCLLQEGVARVYAIDTGYGMLEWKLRNDERIVVMERTNAMHVKLPEPVSVVAIDVGWTPQRHILPNALGQLAPDGVILSLFKPQYEAAGDRRRHNVRLRRGVVRQEDFESVLRATVEELAAAGIRVRQTVALPHGRNSKNLEAFLYICAADNRAP